MEHLPSTGVSWLLNKDTQNKASILHRIKSLECDLTAATQVGTGMQSGQCLEIIEKLLVSYPLYLSFFKSVNPVQSISSSYDFLTSEQIYEKIVQLQQQMTLAVLDAERATVIHQLVEFYAQFKHKLIRKPEQTPPEARIEQPLQRLMQTRKPDAWLLYLVQWFNCHQENGLGQLSDAFQCFQQNEIRCWENIFSDASFLKLFNSLYYYKLFPEQFINRDIPSEKLISISKRLANLYQFIEQIQQLYFKRAEALQIEPVNDLLLHEDELPKGVELHVDESFKASILTALKKWKMHVDGVDDEGFVHECLFDLLRSYKFWFNPERLIDALMVLQEKLGGKCISENFDRQQFKSSMIHLFQTFKTSDCLDLYGYFSNNDSRYLLRLIHHVLHGGEVEGIIIQQLIERQALLRVFEAFHSTMEALREALQLRGIGTQPYALDLERPLRQPGKRKCQAVQRVITVYAIKPMTQNASLEELFEQAERR